MSEAFACGTAAVITGIESFVLENGREVRVGNGQCGPVTHKLFDALRNIQYGVSKDPFGWVVSISVVVAKLATLYGTSESG